jgi:glycosyltransferase involved in cell wall biosynthesis
MVISDDELRAWVRSGRVFGVLQRYDEARLLTERLSTSGRPMLGWVLRAVARRRSAIIDASGSQREITMPLLLRWSWQLAGEALGRGAFLRRVEREVAALERVDRARAGARDPLGSPVYLRTDLSFNVRAGGSVGHIAGVLNELGSEGAPPVLLTTAPVPTLRPDVEVRHVAAPERFWNFRELPAFVLNDVFDAEASRVLGSCRVGFVYQRYSLHNYAGLRLARRLRVPFVLEYNGSEIWMSRHWAHRLKYESIAERIEMLNARSADLVVVVSRAMRDELVARGVHPDQILVNANGVDPDRYRPDLDASAIRRRYGLDGTIVVGFISTFQPWHGAEVLARALPSLFADPNRRATVRVLMIGAGPALASVREIVASAGLDDVVHFAGLVDQGDGPQHLAACDILASPHVPNADGTPFFGSPTKLFEYMAVGRAIVASDLDQIGDVLKHGTTALLVPPGDPRTLAAGLSRLIDDEQLRAALGAAARREAVAHHTWRAHVRRTIAALDARLETRVA